MPPPAAEQASMAAWIDMVFSVLPSFTAQQSATLIMGVFDGIFSAHVDLTQADNASSGRETVEPTWITGMNTKETIEVQSSSQAGILSVIKKFFNKRFKNTN